ncbi:MAG: sel1 repeat family protein [Treponema sp.]|nr:sel1 repeat family protein [Treponema sp.]
MKTDEIFDKQLSAEEIHNKGIGYYRVHRTHYNTYNALKAKECFIEAANLGHVRSMCNLYFLYLGDKDIPRNVEEALKWLYQAVEKGDAVAKRALGEAHLVGKHVSKNYEKAIDLFHQAAEQGDKVAQFNLGEIYEKGKHKPQDYAEAAKWYSLAEKQDFEPARNNLGLMYLSDKYMGKIGEKAAMLFGMNWLNRYLILSVLLGIFSILLPLLIFGDYEYVLSSTTWRFDDIYEVWYLEATENFSVENTLNLFMIPFLFASINASIIFIIRMCSEKLKLFKRYFFLTCLISGIIRVIMIFIIWNDEPFIWRIVLILLAEFISACLIMLMCSDVFDRNDDWWYEIKTLSLSFPNFLVLWFIFIKISLPLNIIIAITMVLFAFEGGELIFWELLLGVLMILLVLLFYGIYIIAPICCAVYAIIRLIQWSNSIEEKRKQREIV